MLEGHVYIDGPAQDAPPDRLERPLMSMPPSGRAGLVSWLTFERTDIIWKTSVGVRYSSMCSKSSQQTVFNDGFIVKGSEGEATNGEVTFVIRTMKVWDCVFAGAFLMTTK